MRKILFLILVCLFALQPVLAADDMMPSKSCSAIAKACKDAGFARNKGGKKFWIDCMKPIILGKTVTGVKVDASTVTSCRTDKINKMKQEITELENVAK